MTDAPLGQVSRRCLLHMRLHCEASECQVDTSDLKSSNRRGPQPTPGAPEVSWAHNGYLAGVQSRAEEIPASRTLGAPDFVNNPIPADLAKELERMRAEDFNGASRPRKNRRP